MKVHHDPGEQTHGYLLVVFDDRLLRTHLLAAMWLLLGPRREPVKGLYPDAGLRNSHSQE